ncbi:hypothetical protein [Nocardioides sp.]|uniref:hypothetical protein n=1 Tax=Nocardioides sp. TaxID=35761 RepID=UPI00352805FC
MSPEVVVIPSDPVQAEREFPWIAYQGQWGERLSPAFYSGPSGPSAKERWTEPFTATERRNEISYQVPAGEVYGVKTTDAFCSVVERGSVIFLRFSNNPVPVLAVLVVLLGLVLWLVRRTSWGSTRAFPLARQRTFGQILSDAWEAYRSRLLLYLGIGALGATVALALSLLQQAIGGGALTSSTPPPATGWSAAVALLAPVLQGAVALLATTACVQTMVDRAEGRTVTAASTYRAAASKYPVALWTGLLAMSLGVVLVFTLILAPLALVLLVAVSLFVPVVVLEDLSGAAALRRSARLVNTQKMKNIALLAFGGLIGSVVGGFVGVLLLALFQLPFVLVNAIPGVVAALIAPWYALALVYAHQDAVLRLPVEPDERTDDDPDDEPSRVSGSN